MISDTASIYAITIYEDNQSVLKFIKEEKLSNKSKHLDTKIYYVKDYVKKKVIDCVYCPTDDMLTKPLSKLQIKKLREACE